MKLHGVPRRKTFWGSGRKDQSVDRSIMKLADRIISSLADADRHSKLFCDRPTEPAANGRRNQSLWACRPLRMSVCCFMCIMLLHDVAIPIQSYTIDVWYICAHWLIFIVNVGTYIPYMDAMGMCCNMLPIIYGELDSCS